MTTLATPTLAQVIREAIEQAERDLRVWMPGTIESFDASAQTAAVQLDFVDAIDDEEGNRNTEEFPLLQDVPVLSLRSGDFFIGFPARKGDKVMVLFCDRNIGHWHQTGGADPGDDRTHDLSGAIAIPGLYPATSALGDHSTSALTFGVSNGCQIQVTQSDIKVGSDTSSEQVVLGNQLQSFLSTLKTYLDTHIHPTSMGNSGPPTTPSTSFPSSALSTKVRTE